MDVYDVSLIPLIIGLVEVVKQIGLPKKYSALVALVFGIALGILYIAPGDTLKGILLGTAMGLGASGLYSTTKNTVEAIKK
ncbi:hypothetical protein PQ689_00285 [Thermoanaerobacterium thermosaccharolyticum]|uniref:hypothetical protein n=1 Tax=Thermoanaerobacterium thermosaccharolyticum TaxID=1517 RepID=UPI003DA81161